MIYEIVKEVWSYICNQEEIELLIRLIIACAMGMVIGFERKNRNKIAGVRTHAIVAFGAALMMIVSKYGFGDIMGNYDASRIASQIVSGVGFLGTGVIFVRDRNSISGLTTAAEIWATSGVGMCIGAGLYFISIAGTLILIIMQEILHRVGFLSNENSHTNLKLTIENGVNLKKLQNEIEDEKIKIYRIKMANVDKKHSEIDMELVYNIPDFDKVGFFEKIIKMEGITRLQEK